MWVARILWAAQIMARIGEIFDRAWLTNDGEVVRQFEQAVADYAGVAHCVATSSGTVALQLAARGLELDGEVIVPSLTFVATPHALAWQRIQPVFADCDPLTWTLDPVAAARLITPRTRGLVGVHLWGQVCATGPLSDLAERHGLRLMFDASHALGCAQGGRRVGNFGEAETLSFHATKFVNAAEGGAVLTNDEKLAARLRQLRNFGFSEPGQVPWIGTNAKMSEISAAIGLTSLEFADEIIAVNRCNDLAYRALLNPLRGLRIKSFNADEPSNFQYVVLEVIEEEAGLTRDELLAVLRAENVLARRYFSPGCHRFEAYADAPRGPMEVTESILARVVTLPTGLAVEPRDVEQIAGILRLALGDVGRTRQQLQARSLVGFTSDGPPIHPPHLHLPLTSNVELTENR